MANIEDKQWKTHPYHKARRLQPALAMAMVYKKKG